MFCVTRAEEVSNVYASLFQNFCYSNNSPPFPDSYALGAKGQELMGEAVAANEVGVVSCKALHRQTGTADVDRGMEGPLF